MCVATAAIVAGVAGAGVSAIGGITSGEARAQQAQASAQASAYQAQVANNNATVATNNANYATEAGEVQAQNENMKGAAQIGKIKTQQAANGLDVNTGSAVAVRQGQAETNAQDVATTKSNALLTAYGYRSQAASDTAQGVLDTSAAASQTAAAGTDVASGFLDASGGLLGSASSLGFKWSSMQDPSTSTSP